MMTACTDFPLGFFKFIPFRIHGAIELVAGVFLLAAPWTYGFAADDTARNFFMAMGIIIVAVVALTDYSGRVVYPPPEPGDRRRFRI